MACFIIPHGLLANMNDQNGTHSCRARSNNYKISHLDWKNVVLAYNNFIFPTFAPYRLLHRQEHSKLDHSNSITQYCSILKWQLCKMEYSASPGPKPIWIGNNQDRQGHYTKQSFDSSIKRMFHVSHQTCCLSLVPRSIEGLPNMQYAYLL